MTYRNGRNREYQAREERGRYQPGGRAPVGDDDWIERDGYYGDAQRPSRAVREPGLDVGRSGGRHRDDNRSFLDGRDSRGAHSYSLDGPEEVREYRSASGWYGSSAAIEAGPDERQPRRYRASARAPRGGRPRPQDASNSSLQSTPRLAGFAWAAIGAGVLLDGLAVMLAWHGSAFGIPLFWLAIIAPFLILAAILIRCSPSPATRQLTVVLLGLYPAVVYRMSSPLVLGGFDEHLHERTLSDLLNGSGLFALNPLLAMSPRYPGLELFTGILIRLTGLPAMAGMSLAVFICRVLLVMFLYQGALAVTRSYRRASLMVIFYAASPQFYFFNSQFAYQTMGLTLGIGGLVLLHRSLEDDYPGAKRPLIVLATLALMATAVAHHATSWITLAFLVGWTATAERSKRRTLALVTAITAIAVINWTNLSIIDVTSYISPIFTSILHVLHAVGRTSLFSDSGGGTSDPLWERGVIVLYALLAASAAVVCGWKVLRRSIRNKRYTLALIGLVSMAYPATLAAHFAAFTASYGDRTSTFMALPAALCCALVVRNPIGSPRRVSRGRSRAGVALVAAAALAYLGGVAFGSGPNWSLLPGKYLVDAQSRSQDSETVAAVRWAGTHLPAGSRIIADRTAANLLAGEARMWVIKNRWNGQNPAKIYFSTTWQSSFDTIIEGLDVQYLYVDSRLSASLPHSGYYFFPYESTKPTQISAAALTKFKDVPGLAVVYRHGPISIYDTTDFAVAKTKDGYVGSRPKGLSPPLQVVAGGIAVLLPVLVLRRRWSQIVGAIGDVGIAASGLTVVVLMIAVGAMLFGLRWIPGPYVTLGAAAMSPALIVALRRAVGKPVLPRLRVPRVHPLVLVGLLALVAGVALDIHSAWSVDVTAVHGILQSVSGGS